MKGCFKNAKELSYFLEPLKTLNQIVADNGINLMHVYNQSHIPPILLGEILKYV
jgi:hypothetical protein